MKKKYISFIILLFICSNLSIAQSFFGNSIQSNWVEYDFGEVAVGQKRECDLFITNVSSTCLHFDYLIPGCNCMTLKSSGSKVKPQKTLKVHVVYDTSNHHEGYNEQSIILCFKEHSSPIVFKVKAQLIRN